MKIIKTENGSEKIQKFKGELTKMGESFKANKKTWGIIIAAMVLIIGAIWVNVALFADNSVPGDYDPNASTGGNVTTGGNQSAGSVPEVDSYFAMALLNRNEAFDTAYETLVSVTTSEVATDEAKSAAFNQITVMAENKQLEANIETLIKAKGFDECIAVISENYVDVIIKSDGLLANEIAQIQEIVLKQAGILPANLTIIERTN